MLKVKSCFPYSKDPIIHHPHLTNKVNKQNINYIHSQNVNKTYSTLNNKKSKNIAIDNIYRDQHYKKKIENQYVYFKKYKLIEAQNQKFMKLAIRQRKNQNNNHQQKHYLKSYMESFYNHDKQKNKYIQDIQKTYLNSNNSNDNLDSSINNQNSNSILNLFENSTIKNNNKFIVRNSKSNIKRQSLLKSYQMFFPSTHQHLNSSFNTNKQNDQSMKSFQKQTFILKDKFPQISQFFMHKNSLSKKQQNHNKNKNLLLNCKNPLKNHWRQLKYQPIENLSKNKQLKQNRQNINFNKILNSSNLEKIYDDLYHTYENVPFNQEEQKIIIEQNVTNRQNIQKNQQGEVVEKLFKPFQPIQIKKQKDLKTQLKSLTYDTDQILSNQFKDVRQNPS